MSYNGGSVIHNIIVSFCPHGSKLRSAYSHEEEDTIVFVLAAQTFYTHNSLHINS